MRYTYLTQNGVSIANNQDDIRGFGNTEAGRRDLIDHIGEGPLLDEILSIWGETPIQQSEPQITGNRETMDRTVWARENQRELARLISFGVIPAESIAAHMEAIDHAAARTWEPGAWYDGGELVTHESNEYLVQKPHSAHAHYAPDGDSAHLYIPLSPVKG